MKTKYATVDTSTLAGLKRAERLHARVKWRAICDAMRPRWAQEAKACIARHNLTVTGDA